MAGKVSAGKAPASKVKAVPDGFNTVSAHLVVPDGAKAIAFYEKAFGAKKLMVMPGPGGQGMMHGEVMIGNSVVMLADQCGPGMKDPNALGGTCVSLHLYSEDAKALFDRAVKAGATVRMPLQQMFWGDLYGCVSDPFGHSWSIAQHVEDVPPEEMPARAAKAFAEFGKCE